MIHSKGFLSALTAVQIVVCILKPNEHYKSNNRHCQLDMQMALLDEFLMRYHIYSAPRVRTLILNFPYKTIQVYNK